MFKRISKNVTQGRSGKTSSARSRTARRSTVGGSELLSIFPKLSQARKRFGIGVFLVVAERQGGDADLRFAALEAAFDKPGERPKAALLAKAEARQVARLLTGLSHPDRIRVVSAIMTGSNTHHLLREAIGLKTGPLYHHIRELKMAGLVTQVSRNFYALSELGKTTILVATGLGSGLGKIGDGWKSRSVRCGRHRGSRVAPANTS